MTPFLDTNIFVRHLANDDPQRSPACLALIQAIEQGRIEAWTSDMVVAEIAYVLSSKRSYNLDRETIRDLILPIINLPGIKLPSKRLYQRVFELYVSLPIDYVDAYHAALMESRKRNDLYSYDLDFDRVPGLTRLEPTVPIAGR